MEIESNDDVFVLAPWLPSGPHFIDRIEQIREKLESSVENDENIENFPSIIFKNLLSKSITPIEDLSIRNENTVDQFLFPGGDGKLHFVEALERLRDIYDFKELLVWDWVVHVSYQDLKIDL